MVQNKNPDRRVIRTKQRLNEALISLISEKGVQSVTVQDITNRADVNRATFYSHYHDKHEMLELMVMEVLQEFTNAINLSPSKNKSSVSDTFVRMFEHIEKHASFYKTMLTNKGVPGFARQMLQIICQSFNQHRLKFQPDDQQLIVPPDILSTYTASAYLGLIIYWLEHDQAYTPEYIATQLTHITKLGLPVVSGIVNTTRN